MYCCEKCFHDRFLINIIRDENQQGNCDYCQSQSVYVAEVQNISRLFNTFTSYYSVVEHGINVDLYDRMENPFHVGVPLFDLIQEWEIFNEGSSHSLNLFNDIMTLVDEDYQEDKNLYTYETDSFYYQSNLNIWVDFTNELKSINRYFPNTAIVNSITEILNQSIFSLPANAILYRGRIGRHEIKDMGAPPPNMASSGRANPKGISYLYTGRDKETCIAELRPYKKAAVTIVTIVTNKELKLIYLNSRKEIISPFQLEGSLLENLETVELYNKLVSELSKPINPSSSELDYLPTQFLSELIKHQGFDGFIFKSSVGPGDNIVIFDERNITKEEHPEYFEVENVEYKIKRRLKIRTNVR